MRYRRLFPLLVSCALTLSCQNSQQPSVGSEPPVPSYLELLERLEVAGNRYRRATDLVRYSSSSFERSLAESHLQFTKEVLESEFELAEIEAKTLALSQPGASESDASPSAAEQGQYDKIAAEVWRLSAEVDEAKERLAAARQNLKKASTAEAFRKVQQTVDQLQKEVEIADKKLDLAGSNLDIQDYKRKRSTTGSSEALSFGERLKMMRNEILPASRPVASGQAKSAELAPQTAVAESQGGIVASVRDYFARREKFKSLRQAQQGTQELVNRVKGSLERRQRDLEALQAKHLELNRKTESAYSQAYQLLQKGGEAAGVARILEEADRQMSDSGRLEQQKELAGRALNVVRRQAALVRDDNEKLASWTGIATEESNDSLFRVGNRVGIVMALILAILVLSHYLKKLPYRFTREGKNLYYFRKLISFTSGLLVAIIVVLNFMGDFGSLTAVLGLAGAGLAIALQDPIVSLVGWFLIVGRFGISVGDRVEINQVKGDVIDIGLLRIAVLEVGNWVGAEQSTGRVVFFPNSFIFKSHYFNYSTGNSFIWDEIRFTVTYESDWKRAREILEEVATRASQTFMDAAKTSQAQLERQYHINLGTLTPYVYVSIASNGVDLVLRYLTGIRKRRSTQDQICQEILQAFGNETGIELSAPARRPAAEAKPAVTATPEPAGG